ncbi:BURP domain-containing protein 3-like [Hibiscus syriacus]|uniref:BURP domain-containing protein 3-like n=1 Tax=Hibiscus syriacus TaxID=106335 RepID=UPI00192391A6|nr:BURP domain-containing protein 3-like [Hibiscus syriacus]
MGNEFVSCSFLLLLFATLAPGVVTNGVDVLRLPSMGHSSSHIGHSSSPSSADAIKDPTAKVFALIKDLVIGNRMAVSFPYKEPSSVNFYPKEITEGIPFSSEAVQELLQYFSFAPDSKQALGMRQTLALCEKEPKEGEIRGCVTSEESLVHFARRILGRDVRVEILRSSLVSKTTPIVQNYTILGFKEIATGNIVPCHNQPYPYPVYHCHYQLGIDNKVFEVLLRGDNGEMVNSVFFCHMDTSKLTDDHVAFRLLGVKPGESEVCHFFTAYDLATVPIPK